MDRTRTSLLQRGRLRTSTGELSLHLDPIADGRIWLNLGSRLSGDLRNRSHPRAIRLCSGIRPHGQDGHHTQGKMRRQWTSTPSSRSVAGRSLPKSIPPHSTKSRRGHSESSLAEISASFRKTGQRRDQPQPGGVQCNAVSVTTDKPVPLESFFRRTNAIGVGSITPYNVNGAGQRVCAGCLTLLRARGRLLSLFTYAAIQRRGNGHVGENNLRAVG